LIIDSQEAIAPPTPLKKAIAPPNSSTHQKAIAPQSLHTSDRTPKFTTKRAIAHQFPPNGKTQRRQINLNSAPVAFIRPLP
jgi:hypothetical protein